MVKSHFYDAIIIGAGNGGLVAAAVAAKQGLKVLLIEQHNLPGGFASSFVRGRFEFEPALHELCDIGPADNLGNSGKLFKDLGTEIEWCSVPDAYRLIVTGKGEEIDVTMPFGEKEFIDKMEEYVPGSRAKTEEFFALCNEVNSALTYLAESKGNPNKKKLIKEFPNFLRTATYSLDRVEKAMKLPEDIKRILNAYWCYLGISTDRINFPLFATMFIKYMQRGAYVAKNRSHEISSALEERIRHFGGEILYNTKVEKILVKDGEVQGVITDSGIEIACKHIISNASPHVVYSSMIHPADDVPEFAKKSLNARRVAPSGFCIYLGLNKTKEELGLKDYSYFVYPTMDTSKLYESMKSRVNPLLQATVCLNNVIPDCSPKGTCIMSFTTLFAENSWDDVKPEDYFREKTRIAQNMIDYFEKSTGIKIKDSIEEIEIATPITFAHYTGSFRGSIYGYETDSWDSVLPRMMMMESDVLIKGLRFAGGAAFRTLGYGSAYLSGETSALLTIKDIKEGKQNG
ncbi:MAG: Phytoene desaturase (neurosporene-forming) [Firmicutes bacterium ADurb.Bin080]|jgi:phytoene dehydrogenase-like protein|nr:NAD(P)/FAD-dependent oxidoreductase [Clostridiales bacterium]OQC14974.1 MAG: Phytoene desaturase (neurosporene-forming) [Firmicutes bacterium ADurb.Bin080]